MSEVQQLLIAAEALVLFTKKQLKKIDNVFDTAIKWQGEEVNHKTRDRFVDAYEKYFNLYDDLFTTIDELKRRHTPAGVNGFVSRHLQPVLDLIGDKIALAERRKNFWSELNLNPKAYEDKDFVERYKDFVSERGW